MELSAHLIIGLGAAGVFGWLFLSSLMFGFLRNQGLRLTWGVRTKEPEWPSYVSRLEDEARVWAVILSIFWPLTVVAIAITLILRAGVFVGKAAANFGGWLAGRRKTKLPEARVIKNGE